MTKTHSDAILKIGNVAVKIGQILSVVAGVAALIAIPALLIFQDMINAEFQAEIGNRDAVFPTQLLMILMTLITIIALLAYRFLGNLYRIVQSVEIGDPFIQENSERLTSMAWLMLTIQVLGFWASVASHYVTERLSEGSHTTDIGIGYGDVLLVIILFILAGVFRIGTEMRHDIEGTI